MTTHLRPIDIVDFAAPQTRPETPPGGLRHPRRRCL